MEISVANPIVAQRGIIRNRTQTKAWDAEWQHIEGQLRWLKYGMPNGQHTNGKGDPHNGLNTYIKQQCAENGDLFLDCCSGCIELLPEFKLADGTVIIGY